MDQDLDFPIVNRSVLILRFKQPYADWANKIDASEGEKTVSTLETLNSDLNSYLIPEIFDYMDLELFIEKYWIILFELQLAGWTTDKKLWPQKRTLKIFNEWFEWQCGSLVMDLWGKEPIGYTDEDFL